MALQIQHSIRLARLSYVALFLAGSLFLGSALTGCESTPRTEDDVYRVTIDGRDFFLELALDNPTRTRGLSYREFIAPDGGMLFVFRNAAVRGFVMRDCVVPIDIIYLDGAGRIVKMYQMGVEPPRDPQAGEGTYKGDNTGTQNATYEQRLRKYSSRFDAQFVIELAGGTLDTLDISEGDLIDLDTDWLESRAR